MASDILLQPGLTLEPMTPEYATLLGPAVAAMEPWSRGDSPVATLTAFFAANDPASLRHVVRIEGKTAGAIAIRQPWLHGPYLQILALLPAFQGQGFGAALLRWFEQQAAPHTRWLWLCYSSFNPRAGAFYARHGFEKAATLPDLWIDGKDEVLMRKQIGAAS